MDFAGGLEHGHLVRVPSVGGGAAEDGALLLVAGADSSPGAAASLLVIVVVVDELAVGAGGRVGRIADGASETGPVAAVAEPGDDDTEGGADADVVHVVAVVLAATDGNEGRAHEGRETQQGAPEAATIAEYPQLARQEQRQVPQPREAEARVPRGEGPPPVV